MVGRSKGRQLKKKSIREHLPKTADEIEFESDLKKFIPDQRTAERIREFVYSAETPDAREARKRAVNESINMVQRLDEALGKPGTALEKYAESLKFVTSDPELPDALFTRLVSLDAPTLWPLEVAVKFARDTGNGELDTRTRDALTPFVQAAAGHNFEAIRTGQFVVWEKENAAEAGKRDPVFKILLEPALYVEDAYLDVQDDLIDYFKGLKNSREREEQIVRLAFFLKAAGDDVVKEYLRAYRTDAFDKPDRIDNMLCERLLEPKSFPNYRRLAGKDSERMYEYFCEAAHSRTTTF